MKYLAVSSEAYKEFINYLDTNGTDDFSFVDNNGNKKYDVRLTFIAPG